MKTRILLIIVIVSLLTGIVSIAPVTRAADNDCWLAIAVHDNTLKVGIGKANNLSDAQYAAKKEAGTPGSGIWSWRRGGCIAVALDEKTKALGMDGGDNIESASYAALDICVGGGGKSCKVILKDCCR